jgi:Ca2+-binding RTX toxin-like protein
VGGVTSITGGSSTHVTVYGNGSVIVGSGNDTVNISGHGNMTVGGGSNQLSLGDGGVITELGTSGHDSISLGSGNDTLYIQGTAKVSGPLAPFGVFGAATVSGGELVVTNSGLEVDITAVSGKSTITGGLLPEKMTGGSGATTMTGGLGPDTFVGGGPGSTTYMKGGGFFGDTFVGGAGSDTMVGAGGRNLFEFLNSAAGGTHVITNFAHGQDQLYLEGDSLSFLKSAGDIKTVGDNTTITLDGGKTHIELLGVKNLTSSDITTHKP